MPYKLTRRREPYWIDTLHGIRLHVRPVSTVIREAAAATAARECLNVGADMAMVQALGGRIEDLPDIANEDAKAGIYKTLYVIALLEHALIEWTGIIGDDDQPVPIDQHSVASYALDPALADDFLAQYLSSLRALAQEGKDSAALSNGTSAKAADGIIAAGAGGTGLPMTGPSRGKKPPMEAN